MREKRVWDWLSEAGMSVAVLFVPLTWPPPAVRGHVASCFLTPEDATWTFPQGFAAELEREHGPYIGDVEEFRTSDRDTLLLDLERMAEQHFAMARRTWITKRPDFLMMVEMGPDRFHHAFWQHIDPSHPLHDPRSPYVEAGPRYYSFLDTQIGRLVDVAGAETTVLVVSDHGARAMEGGVRINEWLLENDLLRLKEVPSTSTPFHPEMVDWARTRAWGAGGYYGRVFLNVVGRDPQGVVAPGDVDAARREIADGLERMVGPRGERLGNRALSPSELYLERRCQPPDLLVFFGDLRLRSLGSVGTGTILSDRNDEGPDGCNHDWDGVFIASGPGIRARGALEGVQIYDVASTILSQMGVASPIGLLGRDRSQG
jgi:predicted AlkP superfamily phosphohydrolase/phosphomutase